MRTTFDKTPEGREPMTKPSREHHSDEFGKEPSASIGLNAPTIGNPTQITLGGIVERESGKTPTPPPFSLRAAVIGLVVMMLLGALILAVFFRSPRHGQTTWERQQYLEDTRSGADAP